jgi:hypothetical protein
MIRNITANAPKTKGVKIDLFDFMVRDDTIIRLG